MEEILASIRKIISEDQPEGGARRDADPQPRAAESRQGTMEADVLELTEEVREDSHQPEPELIDNDIAFESVDEPKRESHVMQAEDLISDTTRGAMGRAFAPLDSMGDHPSGALESIFTRAVQDAFAPTLQEWVDHHQDAIMDQLKPMIRAWMDEHLPHLIELAVQKEISRAVPARRR